MRIAVCVVVACLGMVVLPARADIVFDNTSTGTGKYVPFAYSPTPSNEIGDEVNLAGTAREVTSLSVKLNVELEGVTAATIPSIVAHLWKNDGAINGNGYAVPGTLLDSSTLTDVGLVAGINTVTFDFSGVTVPTHLTWSLESRSPDIYPNHVYFGPATYDPPAVGSNTATDYFWIKDGSTGTWGQYWFSGNPLSDFGAVIVATPEPATLSMLAVGGLLLARRARRSR